MKRLILFFFSIFIISESIAATNRYEEIMAKINHAADTCMHVLHEMNLKPDKGKFRRNWQIVRKTTQSLIEACYYSCDTIFYTERFDERSDAYYIRMWNKKGKLYCVNVTCKRGKEYKIVKRLYEEGLEYVNELITNWDLDRIRRKSAEPTRMFDAIGYARAFRIICHNEQSEVESICYPIYIDQ